MRGQGLAVLLASVVAGAPRAAAQEADGGVLRLYQAGMEIGRETFRENGTRLDATVVIPLVRIRIVAVVERDAGGRPQRLEQQMFALPADTLTRTYTAVRVADSLRLSLGSREWAKQASPDEFGPDQMLAPFISLVQRAHRRDSTWQVWIPNADTTLSFSIVFQGDTVRATIGPQIAVFVLGADGKVRGAEFPQSRVRYERHAAGAPLPPLAGMTPPAPDYTAPASAAWTAEEVRVPVTGLRADTFSLGCTLTRPKAGGPRFPAALTVTGSGQQDRDENLWPLVPAYRLFRQVAERLAAEGIAVLRCDDHGFGASGGPLDSAVSMLDFARNAQAQLAWLRARPDIDGAKLAIVGHSEGGIVGPIVAADDARLAALVIMAGPSKTMDEVLRDQFLAAVDRSRALTTEQRTAAREQAIRDAAAFGANAPGYMRHARTWDPLQAARRVRAPVLVLQGMLDQQVTHGQADTLGAAIRAAGNRDVTVRTFPGLNHLFLVSPDGTGSPDEYAALQDVRIPAAVLETLAEWLRRRLR